MFVIFSTYNKIVNVFLNNKLFVHRLFISLLILYATICSFYQSDQIWAQGDLRPPFLSIDSDLVGMDLWSDNNGGEPNYFAATVIRWVAWQIGMRLELPIGVLQGLEQAVSTTLAFVGTYLLSGTLGMGRDGRLVAAAYFTWNPDWLINPHPAVVWSKALLPLWITVSLKFLYYNTIDDTVNTGNLPYLALAIIIFPVWLSFVSVNSPQFLILFFALFLTLMYSARSRLDSATWLYHKFFPFFFAHFLVSVFFIIYIFLIIILPILNLTTQIAAVIDPKTWSWVSAKSSIINTFLVGQSYWAWNTDYFTVSYYLDHPIVRLLQIFPLSLFFVIFSRQFKSHVFLLSIFITLIFISKGLHYPADAVNLFLYDHIFFMFLLREPVTKLSIFLTYIFSYIYGLCADRLVGQRRLEKNRWTTIYYYAGLLLLITPGIIATLPPIRESPTPLLPSKRITIPHYWFDLKEDYLPSSQSFRIMILPRPEYYQIPYTWGYYGAEFLVDIFLLRGMIPGPYSYFIFNSTVQETMAPLPGLTPDNTPAHHPELVARALDAMAVDRVLVDRAVVARDKPLGSAPVGSIAAEPSHDILVAAGWNLERTYGLVDVYGRAQGTAPPIASVYSEGATHAVLGRPFPTRSFMTTPSVTTKSPGTLTTHIGWFPGWGVASTCRQSTSRNTSCRIFGLEWLGFAEPSPEGFIRFDLPALDDASVFLVWMPGVAWYASLAISGLTFTGAIGYLGWRGCVWIRQRYESIHGTSVVTSLHHQ